MAGSVEYEEVAEDIRVLIFRDLGCHLAGVKGAGTNDEVSMQEGATSRVLGSRFQGIEGPPVTELFMIIDWRRQQRRTPMSRNCDRYR